jgi:hypothetical protein
MDPEGFPSIWERFTGELNTRCQRLCSEIETAWNTLDALLQRHSELITKEEWRTAPEINLDSLLDFAKTKAPVFLFEPLLALKKIRAHERALNAIDHYQDGMGDILRLLPQRLVVSRKDLESSLDWSGKWLQPFLLRLGRKPLSLRMRDLVQQELLEHSVQRVKWDGRLLLLFSQATLSTFIPWQLFRSATLGAFAGYRQSLQDMSIARGEWLQSVAELRVAGNRCLAAYQTWRQHLAGCLTTAIMAGDGRISTKRSESARDRWQACFRYWSSRQRVIVAQLELEYSSGKLLENATNLSLVSLMSVDEEHTQLLSELDKASKWLTDWQAESAQAPFPPPEARLVSAEDRTSEWKRKTESAARVALPAHIESVDLKRPLPGRRRPPRSAAVEASFVKSLNDVGRKMAQGGFREAEDGHRAIIREIERAREVAAYSIEVGKSEGGSDESRQVVKDGITNALSLLAYQKKTAPDYHPVIERRLAEAIASTFFQFHIRIGEGGIDLFQYLARLKGKEAVRAGTEVTRSGIKAGLRWTLDRVAHLNKHIVTKLGWSPPSTVAVEPVARREYLGEILNLNAGPRELPAIYKRLFRLAPVEDQRFLVGRDAEMAAAVQARSLWEKGRSVAILVAGARGSGKTSLLNCVCSSVFDDLPVVSGQFTQRITRAEDMQSFLSSLLQTDASGLVQQFKATKRLIVLEEVERTFLRCIGGFRGLRSLLDLISTTSRNVLWILSLNDMALRYLNRIISIEEFFSHRINAMAVAPQHLRNAILQRHNLSGLRLHFAELPSTGSRSRKIRNLFGFDKDAEQFYFESLYRQSEGIFRSAFELWQQSVDRVEGGVLYMLNPTEPSYGEMISRLTLDDTFVLQTILQHGSLTPEEISIIFDMPAERSLNRIEKLVAWEIIEPDPINPGYRVRPEAGRIVREALYRQNLL